MNNSKTTNSHRPVLDAREAAERLLTHEAVSHYLLNFCHEYERTGEYIRLLECGMDDTAAAIVRPIILIQPDYFRVREWYREKEIATWAKSGPVAADVAIKALNHYEDSYGRLPCTLEFHRRGLIDTRGLFRVLREIWTTCDGVGEQAEEMRRLFRCHPSYLHLMMTAAERRALAALPEEIRVYRGCYPCNRDGLSWSLNQHLAYKFTGMNRYRVAGQTPLMLHGIVSRNHCCLKLGRNEEEIVSVEVKVIREHTTEMWTPEKVYDPQERPEEIEARRQILGG